MTDVLVFDVNETLLDLSALDPAFEGALGPGSRPEWFQEVLLQSFALTASQRYSDFSAVGRAALQLVTERRQVTLGAEEVDALLAGMVRLPPHPEVPAALASLADTGFRMAALTNSTPAVAGAQLGHAGLAGHFEQIMSVDEVQRLKPAPEVYRMAAARLGVTTGEMRMVAAHGWDVAGAMAAGCAGAFIARPGAALSPLDPVPDVIGRDLSEVAAALMARR